MTTEKILMNDDDLDQVSGGTIITYSPEKNESIDYIANVVFKGRVTPEQIMSWNNSITNPNTITPNQQIRILF